ncbi:PREDICTED: acyl-coenzyme A thioesterase 1-like [Cyprinodon variegatus]|uniref:acyl-coenzyme A thioesterase 1-like n=1 Tax=Cyprinodon variegatus TaxID=28743 RepID=UPI0007429947|nr:PREDICTED: acyl-coenzyme A thioesterase 1-like [Cyprinodon variegatus]
MSAQVRLRLLPSARCLFDEPIQVKVAGLRSKQVVTIRASTTDERGLEFTSSANYRADGCGEIDLSRDPSVGGSYLGVEPMGLFWSMKSQILHKDFRKTRAVDPIKVNFSIHEEKGKMLAEVTNERFLMGDGVSRLPVKEGNIDGVLFTPPGKGPFPAVLDLYAYRSEKRACLLANKGFVTLSVPVNIDSQKPIHLDHFEDAVDFLQRLPKVDGKGVGILSKSKGGEVALSLSAFVRGVKAVVWINGCSANTGLPLYYKKKQILPALMFDHKKTFSTNSGAVISKYAMHDPLKAENRDCLVPIEQAGGNFLFVASGEHLISDRKAYMDNMVERLRHHGKDNFETLSYPQAGHYLEPPYGPFCRSSLNVILGGPALWGGKPRSHAAAEVHLWREIQKFFRSHLTCETAPIKPE